MSFRSVRFPRGGRFTNSLICGGEKNYRAIYAGHSMGGAVGVLTAVKDSRIKLLISLAGMVRTGKFYDTEFGEETPDSGCMWDEPDCPLSSVFKNDLKEIHSTAPQAAKIRVPWLLVHGTADDVVLIDDSRSSFPGSWAQEIC